MNKLDGKLSTSGHVWQLEAELRFRTANSAMSLRWHRGWNMQRTDGARTVAQVIDWYLLWASKGKHSTSGQPKSESAIRVQRSLMQNHVSNEFLARAFSELTAQDMQIAIDDVASAGNESAALGLKSLFTDVDKFALRHAVIERIRTHKLAAPTKMRPPRVLSELEFRKAWEGFLYGARDGSVVMRPSCLTTLVSAATLQPLAKVASMRRQDVDWARQLWLSSLDAETRTYVHLSDISLELLREAVDLGDFIHRQTETPFMFPSAGPKRDPLRPVGFSSVADAARHVIPDRNIKPDDLRHTGVATLRAMGQEAFKAIVDEVSMGSSEIPSREHVLIVDAWGDRVQQITKRSESGLKFSFSIQA